MSWNEAAQYAKGVAAHHGFASLQHDPRADDALPLGARIGGLLKLQLSPFIRAAASGSLIEMPGVQDEIITSVSRVRLNLPGGLFRYYTATGDAEGKRNYLQVYQNEAGDIAEIMYCTRLTRIVPETDEDQKAFTGEDGYGLGDVSYSIWKEQLQSIGVSEELVQAVFGDAGNIKYRRDAGTPSCPYIDPFIGHETRIDEKTGTRGLKQSIYYMPYVRDLAGGPEYLLLQTEIIESQDGDPTKRGVYVDVMVGIPIELERVVIQ